MSRFYKSEKADEETDIHHTTSVSPDEPRRGSVSDAVFGEIVEGGPNYRSVGWKGTTVLMLKTQIGLGVLSIPQVFDSLGLITGVICLLVIGTMTTWSGYIVGQFVEYTKLYRGQLPMR
ncbi:MAG: hypothetical protein M1820_008949 [Bogoriella megaspora]|nr:MAG: hypothetical protein M1820_008949 [Bogoriella megaspora]